MTDPITRLNAALEGRYRIEPEQGEAEWQEKVRGPYGKSVNKRGLPGSVAGDKRDVGRPSQRRDDRAPR